MDIPLTIEYVPSRAGKELLVINGFRFTANRYRGSTVYWRCVHSNCHVSAIATSGQIKSLRGEHICPQSRTCLQSESVGNTSKSLPPKLYPIFYKTTSLLRKQKWKVEPTLPLGIKDEHSEIESSNCHLKSNSIKKEPCKVDVVDQELQVPIVDPEETLRLQYAAEIREAWAKNRAHFMADRAANEEKWKTRSIFWVCCLDLPDSVEEVKMVKPLRGTGVKIEQTDVPVKMIDPVEIPVNAEEMATELSMPEEVTQELSGSTCSPKLTSKKRKIDEIESPNSREIEFKKEVKSGPNRSGVCPICNKLLHSSVKKHMKNKHGAELFKCQYCSMLFSCEPDYRAHAKSHMSEEKPFSCNLCNARYIYKGSLKKHIASHTSGKTFSCYACKKYFRKEKYFHLHNEQFHQGSSVTNPVDASTKSDFRQRTVSDNGERKPNLARVKDVPALKGESWSRKHPMTTKRKSNARSCAEEDGLCRPDPPAKPIRPFTLEELRCLDFLQPKVVLSRALTQFLTKPSYSSPH